jgi:hypothetical protein
MHKNIYEQYISLKNIKYIQIPKNKIPSAKTNTRSHSCLPKQFKKPSKKSQKKLLEVLRTEPDTYFENSFGIMVTSSDLYGHTTEDLQYEDVFDSFGNKIYL